MEAGSLNRRVQILKFTWSTDQIGQPDYPDGVWELHACVWADIKMLSGTAYIRHNESNVARRGSVRIRYKPSVTESMRLRFNNETYSIVSVQHDEREKVFSDLVIEQSRQEGWDD